MSADFFLERSRLAYLDWHCGCLILRFKKLYRFSKGVDKILLLFVYQWEFYLRRVLTVGPCKYEAISRLFLSIKRSNTMCVLLTF